MNHIVTIQQQQQQQQQQRRQLDTILRISRWFYFNLIFIIVITQKSLEVASFHHSHPRRCHCRQQNVVPILIQLFPSTQQPNDIDDRYNNNNNDEWDPSITHTKSVGFRSVFQQPIISATTRRRWIKESMILLTVTGTTTMNTGTVMIANAAAVPTTTTTSTDLSQRLQTSILQQPSIGKTTYTNIGNDRTTYPFYMAGTWNVTQTLVNIETPMGLQYAGGPNGLVDIAKKSIQESMAQINKPVYLQLRYVPCRQQQVKQQQRSTTTTTTTLQPDHLVVLEDRLYNTRQRLNSFAGTTVVANVQYADTQASNRITMQDQFITKEQPGEDVPLTTTLTYFKGPAAQKVFVLGHHNVDAVPRENAMMVVDANNNICTSSSTTTTTTTTLPSWTGYEYQRSIFALTNGSTAPPITTDTELIYQFTPIVDCSSTTTTKSNHSSLPINNIQRIRGQLRIIGYLNPNDKYYFDVKNRAVTIQDYILDMKRI